ncbi:NADPH-dependent FMN reductase [Ramlibacter sp. AN1133]|uniref:NADPH-dependent FMN reductase n=1 Tax=Ramlibacter sp. AN1133 TaxID=3133429 RepID=UPI0030C37598
MRVLAIPGSLRKSSYNLMALRAAQKLAPAGMQITIADLRGIPLFDQDLRAGGDPAEVERLRAQVREADAVLIACPEYNASVAGVLKNAIDWVSLPPSQPFDGKPVAILGASPGLLGTSRAQPHLRQVMSCLNTQVVNKPEVFIGAAQTKFDAAGELLDAPTADHISGLLLSLQAMVARRA